MMADRLADGLESQKVLPLAPRGRQFFARPTHPQAESIGPSQVGFPGPRTARNARSVRSLLSR